MAVALPGLRTLFVLLALTHRIENDLGRGRRKAEDKEKEG